MRRIIAAVILLASITFVVCPQSRPQPRNWLRGTWEGTGYQIDTDELWTMRLTVRRNRYLIEYPSLKCSGRWMPFSIGSGKARFRERIAIGADVCTDRGIVVIDRISRRQLGFRYTNPGTSDVAASAILNRRL